MNPLTSSLPFIGDAATTQALGWSILHSLWQLAVLALIARGVLAMQRSAKLRYATGMGFLVLMLVVPVLTSWVVSSSAGTSLPAVPLENLAKDFASAADQEAGLVPSDVAAFGVEPRNGSLGLGEGWMPWLSGRQMFWLSGWLVSAWMLGFLGFSLRALGGLWWVGRMRQRLSRESKPLSDGLRSMCLSLQRDLGLGREIRYRLCDWLSAPAVIGWMRPVVLLPMAALTGLSEQQLRVVLAHELAHIRRHDAWFNLLQVVAEAVLFYHPAVWWLNRKIRLERESCCDDVAVELCREPAAYARALVLMAEWRQAPQMAMAVNRGPVWHRVARILGAEQQPAGLGASRLTIAALGLGMAVLSAQVLSALAPSIPVEPISPVSDPMFAVETGVPTKATPKFENSDRGGSDFRFDFDHLTKAQLAAFDDWRVTPEFVDAIRRAGIDPSADGIVAMRVHGITPEYVAGLQRAVAGSLGQDQVIAMRVQSITPEYAEALLLAGVDFNADGLIAMRVQGVTPEYVESLQEVFSVPLHQDQIIAMRVHGIAASYIAALQRSIVGSIDPDLAIALKVRQVTPEYAEALFAAGLRPSADQVIALHVRGVTEAAVRKLMAAEPGLLADGSPDLLLARFRKALPSES